MKKHIYIGLFVFLGLLIQFFVHGSLEIAYSILLWREFEQWSFGMNYNQLWMIHNIVSWILVVLGAWLGYRSGRFWWNYLYQADGQLKPEFKRKWRF